MDAFWEHYLLHLPLVNHLNSILFCLYVQLGPKFMKDNGFQNVTFSIADGALEAAPAVRNNFFYISESLFALSNIVLNDLIFQLSQNEKLLECCQ